MKWKKLVFVTIICLLITGAIFDLTHPIPQVLAAGAAFDAMCSTSKSFGDSTNPVYAILNHTSNVLVLVGIFQKAPSDFTTITVGGSIPTLIKKYGTTIGGVASLYGIYRTSAGQDTINVGSTDPQELGNIVVVAASYTGTNALVYPDINYIVESVVAESGLNSTTATSHVLSGTTDRLIFQFVGAWNYLTNATVTISTSETERIEKDQAFYGADGAPMSAEINDHAATGAYTMEATLSTKCAWATIAVGILPPLAFYTTATTVSTGYTTISSITTAIIGTTLATTRTTGSTITTSAATIYITSDSPIIIYGVAAIMVLVPALILLMKSRSIAALLAGTTVGLVWAVGSQVLNITALLLLIGVAVFALIFRVRGGGGE